MIYADDKGFQERLHTKIQELVQLISEQSRHLTEVRSPQTSEEESGKNWRERTAQIRGRPLHYPFIGSGLGRGALVELMDGSVKLDFINGIGIHIFGHSHPKVIEAALWGALQDVVMQGNLEPNREYTLALEKLLELARPKSRLRYGWLATCGTMANESALKIARQKRGGARMIVAFENAFAGRSTLMAEITDNPAYREGLPEYHEVLRLPWYDKKNPRSAEMTLAKFKEHVEKHGSNIGVFVFEPMLGEGGYMPAPREFFVPLLELCRQHKIPVWMDEVQTFLRTGEAFAFQTLDLGDYADLVTIAKTAQFGATLYTEEMNPKPGLIAGTFSGSSSSLRAGISVLEEMRTGGYFGPQGRIAEIHRHFTRGLEKLGNSSCQGKVSDVAGLGLMIAFTPLDGSKEKVNAFSQKLFQNGLISFTCGKNPVRMRFLIPASVTNQELDWALQIIEKTLMESA